jgi:ABC-type histidine transport system ATPase subunit
LIRNGLLREDTVLLWDEPENSINPELIPDLVDILLELSKNGVQVFVATHEYNVARYFDVRKDKTTPVLFFNMKNTDNKFEYTVSEKYIELPDNPIEIANEDLFEAVINDKIGEIDND